MSSNCQRNCLDCQLAFPCGLKHFQKELLRNGPDKNDSNNGNEHVGMQKKVLPFLLSVLTSDWLKQQTLTKLHKAVRIFILTFQPSSIKQNLVSA